jgi:hypothetical protein
LKRRLYASELLKKLVKPEELRILEVVWDEELNTEQKIEALLRK